MKRPHIILFISGGLVAAGMLLSFFGSYLVTQGVTVVEGTSSQAAPLEVAKMLDPSVADIGVFVVRTEAVEGVPTARILDPSGQQVLSKEITEKSTEVKFEIAARGEYKLVLESSGEVPAIIAISHMPDKAVEVLVYLGPATIMSGFVGVAIAIIYAVKIRKSS